MSERQSAGEVWNLLKNIYRCADKSSWYDEVAAVYERTRPRYPAEILARMQEIVKLQPEKSLLEIGAGPGIASRELGKMGAKTVCLEPSPAAYAIARRKCEDLANVKLVNSTFEDWDAVEQRFDVVVATTSFHWLDPEVRTSKTAALLKNRGHLVLLWNTPPQLSRSAHHQVRDIYQQYAPELVMYEGHQSHRTNLVEIGRGIAESEYFQDLITAERVVEVTYSVGDYIALLTTLSPYIRLEQTKRNDLLTNLASTLQQKFGDCLELSYLALMQLVTKV